MNNREKDNVSQGERSTEAGSSKRDVSSKPEREDDSAFRVGQGTGKTEELRGEAGRNEGSDERASSATGSTGSFGNMGGGGRNAGVVGSEGEPRTKPEDSGRDRDPSKIPTIQRKE